MRYHLRLKPLIAIFVFLSISLSAIASVEIAYTLDETGAGRWKATYSVVNDDFVPGVRWFSIFYEAGLYDDLNIETLSPLNDHWQQSSHNPLMISPMAFAGFFDARTADFGVVPGQHLRGFSVSFDWLGDGTPTTGQRFEVYDLQNPQSAWAGTTVFIPEPITAILLVVGSGLAGVRQPRHNCRS